MQPALAPSPAQKAQAQRNQNIAARGIVVNNAQKITQLLQSQTVTPSATPIVNFTPRNVGLILGFFIYVQGNMAAASGTGTLTQMGAMNMLTQVQFTDLQNYTRHQTTGWHLGIINAVKSRGPFGACATLTTFPANFGNNFTVQKAPATITTSTAIKYLYYLPISYSDTDLRGSIYAAVVSAQMNLALTINPTPVTTGVLDATLCVYGGATTVTTGGWVSTVTIDVYQVYYDQIPRDQNNNPIVPGMDLATVYELKNSSLTGLTAAQDFQIPYSNYRDYLSTTIIYNNAGVLAAGTDINYWALQAANYANLWNVKPYIAAIWANAEIDDDMPLGTYYFSSRAKPISTAQYGNMNLVINASSVTAGAVVLIGYEDFAIQNQLLGAAGIANS